MNEFMPLDIMEKNYKLGNQWESTINGHMSQ
jgi:hypothetical protein